MDCTAASTGDAQIDWITLQNSDYPFPPAEDIDLTWWDTDMPEGGYDTHLTLE